MKKKYPDNIVYNYETQEFDASKKEYPTSVGAQKFETIKVDKSDSLKANKYFESRLNELRTSTLHGKIKIIIKNLQNTH